MKKSGLKVNIKMYRVGELGDCFLLHFSDNKVSSHVLIDCGSFRNSKESKERLNTIARDIAQQLKGKPLDVVVGTHQHNDHLSGFAHAGAVFREIGIDQVWLPWLDDPSDKDAVKIQEQHHRLVGLVTQLPSALAAIKGYESTPDSEDSMKKIEEVLQFYGAGGPGWAANGNEPLIPATGIKFLKSVSNSGAPEYLYPGQVLDLPGLPAGLVKVYVLGPPKDYKSIKDIHAGKDDTYDHRLAMALEQTEHFLSALAFGENKTGEISDKEEHFPFRESTKVYVEKHLFRDDCVDFADEKLRKLNKSRVYNEYKAHLNKWRTIDNTWINQAESLALYLNDLTNNSSLVLAFELVKSRKVLLFVGDAQTGNWQSWDAITWKEGVPKNKTAQLLANTVLYKVGHHASHNATFKPAFEQMQHPELIAMIPVEKTDPNITKKTNPWRMPAENLYSALRRKTGEKILRMDEGVAEVCKGKNPEWEKTIGFTDLFVDLNIQD